MPLLSPPFFIVYLHLCASEDLHMPCIDLPGMVCAWCKTISHSINNPEITAISSHIASYIGGAFLFEVHEHELPNG